MMRSCPIVTLDKQMTTKRSFVNAGRLSYHHLWNKVPLHQPSKNFLQQ